MLNVSLMHGDDCVDLVAQQGKCTMIFRITGGTGRFKGASGMLTLTETVVAVLADATSSRVFFAAGGGITGVVIGGANSNERQDERP